jgi:hypothetical protein
MSQKRAISSPFSLQKFVEKLIDLNFRKENGEEFFPFFYSTIQ